MSRCLGRRGAISEVLRRDGEVCLEWAIPRFLHLPPGGYYESPRFPFGDARWHLRVWPNVCGRVYLYLRREVSVPPAIPVYAALGLKGSGGAEKREGEIRGGAGWLFGLLCKREELMHRLMPLTITCEMRVPGHTPGTDSSTQTDNNLLRNGETQTDNNLVRNEETQTDNNLVRNEETQTDNNLVRNEEKQGEVLVVYSYKELQEATQNFCDRPAGGFKIGEGSFGTVYRAVIRGDVVAVKKLKDPKDEQFVVELKTLTNYRHDNLVPLLGVSLGTSCCLLYEYMTNGSLEDRLACKDHSDPLSWRTRLSISYGSALGINHLHTFAEKPEVHRDIKSANILLDRNWVPKVGDFGLVRTGDSGGSTTNPVTRTCTGTPGYMPREALVGDVSVKWDTYSFGVVLLELLTGLPPFDPNRKHRYLITHMEHCKDIISRLDPKAKWSKEAATELYQIAQKCLEESKRSRPTISEILEDLRKLSLFEE